MRSTVVLTLLVVALGAALVPGAGPAAATPPLATSGYEPVSFVLTIGSLDQVVGERGSVVLEVTAIEGQVRNWTVFVAYDPAVVAVADCTPSKAVVCESEPGVDEVRVTSAGAKPLTEDATLATISFDCIDGGTSALELGVQLAIFPEQSLSRELEDGVINCVERVETDATKTATPAAPPHLPATGAGPTPVRQVRGWWPVGLSLVLMAVTGLLVAWSWQRRP